MNGGGQSLPDATSTVVPLPAASATTSPGAEQSTQLPQTNVVVPVTGAAVGLSAGVASITVLPPVRIARITISDFRGFPPGEPYRFQLENGKNMLLHGENGAGKTSLFHALRLLLSPQKPNKPFTGYQHIFAKHDATTAGVVAIDLTAGMPSDYRWDAGNPHPSEDKNNSSFLEIARRATFLDYKALLRTSFLHEDKGHINLFHLLVETMLRDVEFPDGRTVAQRWHEVRDFYGSRRRRNKGKEARREQINRLAKAFSAQLNDLLNAEKVGVVTKTNKVLATLSSAFSPLPNNQSSNKDFFAVSLEVGEPALSVADGRRTLPPHEFVRDDVTLRATFGGKPIDHPAIFFNEARLTAIALALYLGTALATVPKAKTSNLCPLLVLDDALIGLDLAHRQPLLDILKGEEFKDWQIFLLTFDDNWFDMANDYLPDTLWAKHRLHAKAHEDGWEVPVLEADLPYLDRAWNYIQSGDFKAAAVYLRTAFEATLREFCIAHSIQVGLKENLHDYTSEDLWPLVRGYNVKDGQKLVDGRLAAEITLCRRYVLNPLCHNDPDRPTREEIRRAHAAVTELKGLLGNDLSWRKQLRAKLSQVVTDIVGNNETRRKKALQGIAPSSEFALYAACQLLGVPIPQATEIATLLRSAFDRMLWNYCVRKHLPFTLECGTELTTQILWDAAKVGATGLTVTQPGFVTAIEPHANLFLVPDPTRDVCAGKSQSDLEALCNLFAGPSWKTEQHPRAVMDGF